MISRKLASRIELIEFCICVFLHVIFSAFFIKDSQTMIVGAYAVGTFLLAAGCLYLIKDYFISQICFVACVFVATYTIGSEMKTLAYGIFIYIITGALIAIIGDRKLNQWYVIFANFAIVINVILEPEIITRYMPMHLYGLLVFFFEMFLLTENFMVMLYDVKVQETEKQNKLLEIAQRSKDEFLANMSHEIRTPMNAIIGMSELIMREDGISDTVRENCYGIKSSGDSLLNIINDILDFSKIESGKLDIHYDPYNIAETIQNVINTTMFRRGYKNIAIIIDCNPNIPRLLIGDELRNRQILINLMNNAVKYTDKGYVFLSVDCYEQNGTNWLRMIVEDTGSGIKSEDQARLFESFSRVDTKRNRSIEGTGLGLVICKRLVEMMGGTIALTSEYGVGTRVEVNVPQEISEQEPFLRINEPEKYKVVLYGERGDYTTIGKKKYAEVTHKLWNDFGVEHKMVTEFSELLDMLDKATITHLFIGYQEYCNQRAFYDKVTNQLKVFVILDPQVPSNLGERVHGINIPFYAINVVTALNGESFFHHYIDEQEVKIRFRAPTARVLIVDDNDINLRVAEGIFKLYDLQTELAHGGKVAIELLKEQDFDIIFMDHMMPELDGVETVEIIRRTYGNRVKDVPIIAITANVANDVKEMFLQNGFQDFVAKPVALKAIDEVLRKWLKEEKIDDFIPMVIDEASALENMGGMKDLFKELLEYCIDAKESRLAEIQQAFDAKDYQEYEIRVHALKGAMRSLGVEELALAAQKQEFACKEGRIEDAIAGHAQFLEAYERGHRSIQLHLEKM